MPPPVLATSADRSVCRCVIRGCVPKKLMVYACVSNLSAFLLFTPSIFSSHFAEDFEDAGGFGWEIQETRKHDWKKLVANKV